MKEMRKQKCRISNLKLKLIVAVMSLALGTLVTEQSMAQTAGEAGNRLSAESGRAGNSRLIRAANGSRGRPNTESR